MGDGDSIWDTLLDCWWGQILIGMLFFVVAAFLYWYISPICEATRRQPTVSPWIIAIGFMNIAGQWAPLSTFWRFRSQAAWRDRRRDQELDRDPARR